jgi:hypothetical protein
MRRTVPDRTNDINHHQIFDNPADDHYNDATVPGRRDMRDEPEHRPDDDVDAALRDDYNPGRYNDVIVNNEYDLYDIDDDLDRLDDGTPKFNNDNYVVVRRADYDNLVAALDHLADDADYYYDLVIAARKLIDHHDDAAGDARHR